MCINININNIIINEIMCVYVCINNENNNNNINVIIIMWKQ